VRQAKGKKNTGNGGVPGPADHNTRKKGAKKYETKGTKKNGGKKDDKPDCGVAR